MNNLLRTLTESKIKTGYLDCDLKLLLTTVKEGRRQTQDSKLSDPFYDSLEGLLLDLRTTTIDNHDAEAFLKPVSKSEVPDYYDVIATPMDLQTMLKKVKNKNYKSKREFKDDLDLIWSNCFLYNAVETHPLRQCASRLKIKAERLLRNITDQKERVNPVIPPALGGGSNTSARASPLPPKPNGVVTNGHRPPTITIKPRKSFNGGAAVMKRDVAPQTPFADMPALVRTAEGMRAFTAADADADPERLRAFLPAAVVKLEDDGDDPMDGVLGDKRPWTGVDDRPRKRQRADSDPHVWWAAVQSDALLPNGLPHIAHAASRPQPAGPPARRKKKKKKAAAADGPQGGEKAMLTLMNGNIRTMRRLRHTHARFAALGLGASAGAADDAEVGVGVSVGPADVGFPEQAGDEEAMVGENEVDERRWGAELGFGATTAPRRRKGKERAGALEAVAGANTGGVGVAGGANVGREEPPDDVEVDVGAANADSCMRWMSSKVLEHAGFQGTSKVALDILASVTSEYLLNVGRTIRYLCDKYSHTMTAEEIILHTLFESGISRVQDLERYISDDVERYGARLGDLEKKLVGAYREVTAVDILSDEGLFDDEEEVAMGDFADALGEDYLGLRELGIAAEFGMSSLSIPKKLLRGKKRGMGAGAGAGNAAAAPPPLPYPLPPPFVPLTPRKVDAQIGLLRPYYTNRFNTLVAAAAHVHSQAPLGMPPPLLGPPGTLPTLPGPPRSLPVLPGPPGTLPPLPGPPSMLPTLPGPPSTLPGLYGALPGPLATLDAPLGPPPVLPMAPPPLPPMAPALLPHLELPDDAPSALHAKMGPLGQILLAKPGAKKKTAGTGTGGGGAGGAAAPAKARPVDGAGGGGGESKKKKKGATGVGTGNGRKKGKGDGALMPPPPVPAPIVAAGI
ncbi:SAGA complex protein [Mycena belliarum]|uniref:SAGA complex protein n=1 Tax=Mycena belliarum TaxID=1033014 RepID=A0AAD6XUV4_9AGAR|nr:SAGA complex protein [Mycena belliae]